jgi:hypothetical protein
MLGFGRRFWVNVLGRILPLSSSLLFAIFSTNNTAKGVVFLIAALVLILVEYLGVYRPLQRFEDVIRKQFDFYFEPFLEQAQVDGEKADLRVNIMLVRRTICFCRKFFQFYQKNMEGYPDANLNFSIKRGLCGYAFRKGSQVVMYRDLRGDTREAAQRKFHWSQEQFDLTDHVKAVATIPLYRQRTAFRGHIRHKYFGVLNIDATNDAGVEFLADPDVQQQITGFARFVQLSLA